MLYMYDGTWQTVLKCPQIDMLQYQHRFWQNIVLMNQSYPGDFFSHTMARAGASVSHWHISSFI